MMQNTLFQSLDRKHELSDRAKDLGSTLDQMTSQIVGRLISERLIDYAGQPGQVIEYLAAIIGDSLIKALEDADTVQLAQFWAKKDARNEK